MKNATTGIESRGKIRETKLRRHQTAPYMISGRLLTKVARSSDSATVWGIEWMVLLSDRIMSYSATSSK
jgi:hypothetical protein